MKIGIRGVWLVRALVGVGLIFSLPSRADTDYRCLNLCVEAGKTNANCMQQCSYNLKTSHPSLPKQTNSYTPVPETAATGKVLSNHRILPTLQPADDSKLSPEGKPASPYRLTKDYKCMAQCLQNKMAYQTCDADCTTISTRDGKVVKSEAVDKIKPVIAINPEDNFAVGQ